MHFKYSIKNRFYSISLDFQIIYKHIKIMSLKKKLITNRTAIDFYQYYINGLLFYM